MMLKSTSIGLRFILIVALLMCALTVSVGMVKRADAVGSVNLVIDADPSTPGMQTSIEKVKNSGPFQVDVWLINNGGQPVYSVDAMVNFTAACLQVDATTYDAFQQLAPSAGTLFDMGGLSRDRNNTLGYADFSDGATAAEVAPTASFLMHSIIFNPVGSGVATLSFQVGGLRPSGVYGANAVNLTDQMVGITVTVLEPPNIDFTTTPANGQIAAGDNVQFTAVIIAGPITSWAWNFGDGTTSTLQNPTHQYTVVGSYTVQLTATNSVGTDTESKPGAVVVSPGTPAKLAFGTAPVGTATAGVTWTTFTVRILDTYNNLTTSGATVDVTTTGGAFTTGNASKGASSGVATFDDLKYNTAGTVKVNASSGILTGAQSGDVVVSPAAANKVVFTVQPAAAGSVDVAFGTQPTLQIQDIYGNLTSSTATVELSDVLASDTNTGGAGNLTGTVSKDAVGGIAGFTGIGYTKLDTILIKAVSTGLQPAISTNPIALTPGANVKLAFGTAPTSPVGAGEVWDAFTVRILDQYDNLTTSTVEVTVTPSAGGFVLGDPSKAALSGTATFDDLTYTNAGIITVTASSGTLQTVISGNITVNPDVLHHVTVTPATPTVVVEATRQFAAEAQDQYNNVLTGYTFIWSVTNATAGGINGTGLFTAGQMPGTYAGVIKAKVDGNELFGTTGVNVQGATITVTAILQGGNRPNPDGYTIPYTLKVFAAATVIDATNAIDAVPLYALTVAAGNITVTGVNATTKTVTLQVAGLPLGTYNLTLYTPYALINLYNGVVVAVSGTNVNMGTMLFGNPQEDFKVTAADFALMLTDYLAEKEGVNSTNWNSGRCDFNRDNIVQAKDFSLVVDNYNALTAHDVTPP